MDDDNNRMATSWMDGETDEKRRCLNDEGGWRLSDCQHT